MSREIKFRFWDIQNKKWTEGMGIYSDGIIGDFSECFHNIAGDNGEFYIAQQFTGLLDEQGVEIYEGDIIGHDLRKWEVVWNEGGFFEIKDGEYLWEVCNKMRVIGNIFIKH